MHNQMMMQQQSLQQQMMQQPELQQQPLQQPTLQQQPLQLPTLQQQPVNVYKRNSGLVMFAEQPAKRARIDDSPDPIDDTNLPGWDILPEGDDCNFDPYSESNGPKFL